MFIGHFALGYAAKRWVPQVSLGVLFAAVALADVIWPVLVAVGIEHVRIAPGITAFTPLEFISYPYSHSLAALVLWGALFGWICSRPRPASVATGTSIGIFVVMLALVLSHWVLDFITHIPDMPLYPGGARYGLGLWNSVAGTLAVEVAMFVVGVSIYARATRARDRIGTWAFAGLVGFLLIGFVSNVSAPPPPSVSALWIVAVALSGLIITLAHWTDRHRASR